ncbi:hypothetical protein Btru_052268 [Bulinus truncatus]|nr:hypothetical protein Btru_052268 [Bulinus truncatus]
MLMEGDSVYLNCSVFGGVTSEWSEDNNIISTCNNSHCQTKNSDMYKSSIIPIDGMKYHQLNIKAITRHANNFTCFVDGVKNIRITICVTTQPAKPTCNAPTFVDNNSTLLISCRTSKVYPDAMCSLLHWDNGVTLQGSATAFSSKVLSDTPLSDVEVTCNITLTLKNMPPTSENFKVTFTPTCDITKGIGNARLTTESDFSETISLELPSVSPLGNCQNNTGLDSDYIPIGSSVACLCELQEIGNPPGKAKWFTKNGQETGTVIGRTSVLNVKLNSSDLTPEFQCRPNSILNTSMAAYQTFQPKFAYGPSVVLVTGAGEYNVCFQKELTISCQVPVEKVRPNALFTISEDSKELVSQQNGLQTGSVFSVTYTRPISTQGKFTFRCRAQNLISHEYFVDEYLTVELKGPPPKAPTIKVTNSDIEDDMVYVNKDDNIQVSCQVDGGYPLVKNMTLICQLQTVNADGQFAKWITKVNENLDGQSCMCRAVHETGCYYKTSQVIFKVKDKDMTTQWLAIGLGTGGGILLIVIVIAVFCVRRRSAKAENQITQTKKSPYDIPIDENEDSKSIYHEIEDNNDYLTPKFSTIPEDYTWSAGKDNFSFNTSPTYDSSTWTLSNQPPLCDMNRNQQNNEYIRVI